MEERIFIGLGSNLGARETYLVRAIAELRATSGVILHACSSVLETEPVGVTDQPKFLNAVLELRTSVEPGALLKTLRSIEQRLGRVKRERWREREIDLDILYFGSRTIDRDGLKIPHPEIANRKFVLAPLAELAPDFIDPMRTLSIRSLLEQCPDQTRIQPRNDIRLEINTAPAAR